MGAQLVMFSLHKLLHNRYNQEYMTVQCSILVFNDVLLYSTVPVAGRPNCLHTTNAS